MIWVVLIFGGLLFGSFINALTWRLHAGEDWIRGRSHCVKCQHVLAAKDLVPVLSWLWLKGKCRYCHKKIDDNPWVELALPLFFLFSYIFWPASISGWGIVDFSLWLIFLVGFLALAVYDLRWFLLPNKIIFPLIGLAVGEVGAKALYYKDWKSLLAAAAGALVVAGLFYVLFQLSQGKWIGGGDVKLGIVLGLLAGGFYQSILLLFIASLVGLVFTLPLLVTGKMTRKTQLPFGPFLIMSMVIVKLFGAAFIAWYTGFLSV